MTEDKEVVAAVNAGSTHAQSQMGGAPFARLRMNGVSFKNARVPVEALAELQRYQTAVLKAAMLAWTEHNPGDDIPDDFATSFRLVLANVEEGSATSVLESPAPTQYDEYFEMGREEFEREFEVVTSWLNNNQSSGTPLDVLLLPLLAEPSFVDFGSNIPDDEEFTVSSRTTPVPIEITARLREEALAPLAAERAALLAPPAPPARESIRGEVAGQLVTLNAEKRGFDMISLRFGRIHGRYRNESLTADLRKVLDSKALAPVVRVTAQLRYQDGVLKELLDVTMVQLLEIDGKPWSRRFRELASLDAGWDEDATSQPIEFTALDAARTILEECLTLNRAVPGIFPMSDGGVQLEWASPDFVTSVEISPQLEYSLFDLDIASRRSTDNVTLDLTLAKDFVKRTAR